MLEILFRYDNMTTAFPKVLFKMCSWSLNYPSNNLEVPHLRYVGNLNNKPTEIPISPCKLDLQMFFVFTLHVCRALYGSIIGSCWGIGFVKRSKLANICSDLYTQCGLIASGDWGRSPNLHDHTTRVCF